MKVVLLALTVIVAAFVGYKLENPAFTFRVRLTIVVEGHGQQKSASSVIELSEETHSSFGGLFGSGSHTRSRGEAVFLDLGNGNNLFGLLGLAGGSRDDILRITQRTFFDAPGAPDYGTPAYARRIVSENKNKPKELHSPNMPTLVHFRDLLNRRTMRAVDPATAETMLGRGIKLIRVTLEITDAPVTEGVIDRQLPWLKKLIGDSPMEHLPIYNVQQPELAQDRIFFVGFRRN